VAGTASTNWPTQPKAHPMMTYLKETFNYKTEEQDTVEKAASIHVQYEGKKNTMKKNWLRVTC
jgi:hypothetical protein